MSIFFKQFKSFQDPSSVFGKFGQGAGGEVFGLEVNEKDDIPPFLFDIEKFVLENVCVGIFRKNGRKDIVDEIIEVIDIGEEITIDEMKEMGGEIHSLCGVYKHYFREMADPLLTYGLYQGWIDAFADEEHRLEKMKKLVKKLNSGHQSLLKRLMGFLKKLATYEATTKMGEDNLALVFAPNLLRPKELNLADFKDAPAICQLVGILLKDYQYFFLGKKLKGGEKKKEVKKEVKKPKKESKEEKIKREERKKRLSNRSSGRRKKNSGKKAHKKNVIVM